MRNTRVVGDNNLIFFRLYSVKLKKFPYRNDCHLFPVWCVWCVLVIEELLIKETKYEKKKKRKKGLPLISKILEQQINFNPLNYLDLCYCLETITH